MPARPRLLVCCVNYAPEVLGTAPYTRDLAEWFAEQDWDVRVVTTHPYYPAWRRWPGWNGLLFKRHGSSGVDVWRGPSWVPASPTGPKRIAHWERAGARKTRPITERVPPTNEATADTASA